MEPVSVPHDSLDMFQLFLFFVAHIQSWENIFDQTTGYIAVYIFVHSSVICGLVNYIFLTLYVRVSGQVTFSTP